MSHEEEVVTLMPCPIGFDHTPHIGCGVCHLRPAVAERLRQRDKQYRMLHVTATMQAKAIEGHLKRIAALEVGKEEQHQFAMKYLRDVHERDKRNAALEAENERLRIFLEHAVKDNTDDCSFCDQARAALTGRLEKP